MAELEVKSVAEALLNIVDSAPGQTILGARLGALLKGECPTFTPFSFQCRNLRQFISVHVPLVEERGRSGPDYVYGPASKGGKRPHPQSAVLPPLKLGSGMVSSFNWRAFTHPTYPFQLVVNRADGDYRVVPLGESIAEPWVSVPKTTPERHLEIAKAFAESMVDEICQSLNRVLTEPKWFINFSTVARRLGVGGQWSIFRTSRLKETFNEALTNLGIPEAPKTSTIPKASATPISSQSDAPLLSGSLATKRQGRTGTFGDDLLRSLIQRVIADLPSSDLRAISLPVGRVLDSLSELQK